MDHISILSLDYGNEVFLIYVTNYCEDIHSYLLIFGLVSNRTIAPSKVLQSNTM